MKPNPVFKWSAYVFGFWWVFFLVFGNLVLPMMISGWQPTLDKEAMGVQLRFWGFGLGVGAIGVIASSLLVRQARQKRLAGQAVRGMQALIGKVPLRENWFDESKLPRKEATQLAAAAAEDSEIWRRWRRSYLPDHPRHVALADVLMAMYEAKKDYPATHHEQGHADRTLGAHCLAVAAKMVSTADGFRYTGLRNKRGKLVAAMQRADGINLSTHPLVFITGLAHDLGKIDGYEFKDGKVVGCVREHDLLSARMLGRLPETWGLPPRDREALLTAVGHYHHMMSFPLDQQGRVSDDLAAALMQHLHDCDVEVSGMEVEEEYDKHEIEDLSLYEAFIEVVSEVNRINGSEKQGAVGQKWKDLVILHEVDLSRAIADKLGRSGLSSQACREEVSLPLVAALRERSLMASSEDVEEVEFKSGGQTIATWPDAIAIRPGKILPGLTGMSDYDPRGTAVLKGNPDRNKFVSADVEAFRARKEEEAKGTKTSSTSKSATSSTNSDDDDMYYGPNGELVFGTPPVTTSSSSTPATAPSAKTEPPRPSVENAAAATPVPSTVERKEVAPETSSRPTEPLLTQPEHPTAERSGSAKPTTPTQSTTPKEADGERRVFAMKDLAHLVQEASANRVSGKGSRLQAFFLKEIKGEGDESDAAADAFSTPAVMPVAPAASHQESRQQVEAPSQPSIPAMVKKAVDAGDLSLIVRPSGLFVARIDGNVKSEPLLRWIEMLPESKSPEPASRLVVQENKFLLLHKDWQSFVAPTAKE